MSQDLNPSASLQPLNLGNVISAGFVLYRSHLKSYLGIAAIGILWIVAPFVLLIPIVLGLAANIATNGFSNPGLLLLFPVWLALFFYCLAHYLANSALISRLAFNELMGQPETVKEAGRYTSGRKWSFLLLSFLVGLITFGVLLGLYIGAAVLVAIVVLLATTLGGGAIQNNPVAIILLVLLGLAAILAIITFICWFTARLTTITELPLAVENGIDATRAISRTWELTKGYAWRIFLIIFITALLGIPIQVIVQIAVSIFQGIIPYFASDNLFVFNALTTIFVYVLGLLGSIVLIPLWQSIKAVIYYDLRNRQEGLGLQLRDRQ